MIGYLVLLQLCVFIAVQARPNIDCDTLDELVEDDEHHSNLNKGFNLRAFREDQLNIHNYYRKLHRVPKMTMTKRLTAEAQKYAERLAKRGEGMKHCHSRKCNHAGAGENLATAWGGKDSEINATKEWYDEIWDYNFCFDDNDSTSKTRPGHTGKVIGHFTQVVWKDSVELGIGYARSKDQKTVHVVGRYLKAGNYQGRYEVNVLFPDYLRSIFQDNCDGTNGELTSWSGAGECSQSCGGGVQFKTRTCTAPKPSKNGKDCEGKIKEIAVNKWCNIESCPGGKSYRELQCEIQGASADTYESSESPCELYCKALNGDGSFEALAKVEDGTQCNSGSGACVAGVCKPMPTYVAPTKPPKLNAAGQVIGEYKETPTPHYYDTAFFTLPNGAKDVKIINKDLGVKIYVGFKAPNGGMGHVWGEGPFVSRSGTVKGVSFIYDPSHENTESMITFEGPVEPDNHDLIVLFAESSVKGIKADITWSYER